MKRILTLLILLALGGLGHAQTPGEHFDATHYEVQLWGFDFTAHTLQGEAFITVSVTEATDTFVFELKSLTVTDAANEYYDVTSFEQDGDLLTLVVDETLPAGTSTTFDIRYGGATFSETWGGVEWWGSGYVYNLGVGFDSQPHNLGKTWFPCVDNFTDKATYTLYATVDNDKKAVCGGNHINTFDNGDGTSTWYYEYPQEIATYHVSFAIGDYVVWENTYHGIDGDIPVEVYVKPAQLNHVPGTFAHVNTIADFYEQCLGAYPFNRIGYVSTGKGCMEHVDNIAMASSIIDGTTSGEEYVAHELSHMYFGNKTTCSTAGDMWLNEGFAQFWGLFYRVGVYGEDDFQAAMSTLTNTITSWCNNEAHWIPLNNMPLDMTYDSDAVYNRGAVIINTMMNYMGRDNFLEGLRHYLDTYAYGAASSEQLRDALTEATGIDMTGFFDNYVFIGGLPHYSAGIAEVTPNGSQYDALVKLGYWHVGPSHVGMNNRVEVTFVGAEGQLHTEMAQWDGLEGEQTFTLDFEPVAVFTDYDNHFLDAKIDKNAVVATPSTFSLSSYFQAIVNSVTDSVMLRAENHLVAPDDDPEIPWLTLSTSHYWNFFRHDMGEADVNLRISYSNSANLDGDIIHTENDSAVLLYRADINEAWHSIPYTQEGTWKMGRFVVNNAQSGQYTIAVIDKTLWSLGENKAPAYRVYPVPAHDRLQVETPNGVTTIDVSKYTPGVYFIEVEGKTIKFIKQ